MTSNQIAYWKNVETERSNRADEALQAEKNAIAQQEADVNKKWAGVNAISGLVGNVAKVASAGASIGKLFKGGSSDKGGAVTKIINNFGSTKSSGSRKSK